MNDGVEMGERARMQVELGGECWRFSPSVIP